MTQSTSKFMQRSASRLFVIALVVGSMSCGREDGAALATDAVGKEVGCTEDNPEACIAAACVPTTCAAAEKNCGEIADGCGGGLFCGVCEAPQTCGGGGLDNVCGCTPETDEAFCLRLGMSCAAVSDVDNCGAPRTCDCNLVLPAACVPLTCAQKGVNCGSTSDGCGGVLQCGRCCAGDTCSSNGDCCPSAPYCVFRESCAGFVCSAFSQLGPNA